MSNTSKVGPFEVSKKREEPTGFLSDLCETLTVCEYEESRFECALHLPKSQELSLDFTVIT